MMNLLLKSKIDEQSQIRQNDFISRRQQELAQIEHDFRASEGDATAQAKSAENLQTAAFAHPDIMDRPGAPTAINGLPASMFKPTDQQRGLGQLEDIGKADTLEKLPTPQETLAKALAAGMKPDPYFNENFHPPTMKIGNETRQMVGMPEGGDNSPIGQVMQGQQGREGMLRSQRNVAFGEKPHILPSGATGITSPSGQDVATGLTGIQQGQQDLEKSMANELSPAYGVAKAQLDKTMADMMRGSKAADASAIAGGTLRGQLAPDIINMEVDKEGRIAQARADASKTGTLPTDTERKQSQQAVEIINAHAGMLELENQGVGLPPGVLNAIQSPAMLMASNAIKLSPPAVQQYANHALVLSNLKVYQLSGMQTNESEFPRFVAMYVHFTSDSPALKAQKDTNRRVALTAMQIGMGNSKYEGGQSVGRSIAAGLVKPEILDTFIMDPEFKKGVVDAYPAAESRQGAVKDINQLPFGPAAPVTSSGGPANATAR